MNVRPAPQVGHLTSDASGWSCMGGSGTASLPLRWLCLHNTRSGLLAACWATLRTIVADVTRRDVDHFRAPAALRAAMRTDGGLVARGGLWHHPPLAGSRAGTLNPGPNRPVIKFSGDTARLSVASVVEHVAVTGWLTDTAV
jgi:hypothetical protein